jgi:outer membrane protein assembly factor BamB
MSTHTRPVVGAEGVYFGWADDAVGSGSGDLYAVGFDGTERWTHDVGSVYDPPVVRDGAVYVGGDTGAVYGFDESGEELWRFTPETETERQPFEASVVDVEEGVVYAVAGGVVFAVDAVEGEGLWRFGEGSVSTPHVDDGTVYFSGTGRVAACADGEKVWSHEVEGTNSWVHGVTSGNVYFRHKYDLRVLDAETGDERWSVNMDDGYVTAFGDDTVYAGVDGLHAFAHDGGEVWTVELDGSEIDGMTVGNGYVYAVTEKEAHRIEEVKKEGSTEIPGGNVLSHAATDGRVYVGSREGVYALGV